MHGNMNVKYVIVWIISNHWIDLGHGSQWLTLHGVENNNAPKVVVLLWYYTVSNRYLLNTVSSSRLRWWLDPLLAADSSLFPKFVLTLTKVECFHSQHSRITNHICNLIWRNITYTVVKVSSDQLRRPGNVDYSHIVRSTMITLAIGKFINLYLGILNFPNYFDET
jgi:hypothetical protein